MLKQITKQHLVILVLLIASNAKAQQWLGRTTSNYAGTYGIYNNASSIADAKYKYYFNFWGRGVNFYNNYIDYNAPIKLNEWANGSYFDQQYTRLDGKPDYKKNWLKEDLNGEVKQFSFNQDIWGPAFMFPVSKKASMSINTRQRSSLQLFGISEPFARMAFNGIDSNGGIYNGSNGLQRNTTYNNGKFGVNAQSFQELSFTYAGVISKNDHHQLNGGLTVKFLRGLGAAYIKGSDLDINITGNNNATITSADIEYAYNDDKSVIAPYNKPYGLFTLQSKGGGAGLDLGLSYAYTAQKGKYFTKKQCNNNNERNDYDFKLSMAINDIGGIRYNKNSTKYNVNSGSSNIIVSNNILNGFNQATQNAFDTIGTKVFGQMGATKSSGFSTSLPTAFNLQADFRLAKGIYTQVFWNHSLKGINSTGMRSTSMLSVIPRIESRGFEFSMPITLGQNYKNVTIGSYIKIGPVFFGSDNLGGLLNVSSNSNFRGADIYGGVAFGIGHCHRWWYENKVDRVYQDTVKQRDTIKEIKRDTIKIIQKDTVYLKKGEIKTVIKSDTVYINKKGETKTIIKRDTVYIEKIIKTPADNSKEKELNQKEIELNTKQKQLEQREKELIEKEKGTFNETEALRNCKNQNNVLVSENVVLRTRTNTQADEIIKLQRQIDELKRNKNQQDAEIATLKNCNGVVQYDERTRQPLTPCQLYEKELAKRKQCETEKAANIAEIERLKTEIIDLKKGSNVKTDANVIKGNDADKLLKANKKIDSLNLVLIAINKDLDNCKKTNGTQNDAEIVKAKADATKAKKQADSLNIILSGKIIELENCKKTNGTQNDAEIVKAKADATKAKKQADSLNIILSGKIIELENCKKNNGSQNDAEIVKAKADATKAKKQADSLNIILSGKIIELENCKKNNGSQNDAEIVKAKAAKEKAENDAKWASKKADSLQTILNTTLTDLENCKKNTTNCDAYISQLNKCKSEKEECTIEMRAMVKVIADKNYRINLQTTKIDSLILQLKKCNESKGSSNTDNDELLKKCNDAKAELEAEVIGLRNYAKAVSKSLDSLQTITNAVRKQKTDAESELAELKAKQTETNCDEYKKQIEEKNKSIADLQTQNTTLQNRVSTLSNQLKELQTEYNFLNSRNQLCGKQLDSCKRGLTNHGSEGQPKENGGNGPNNNEGSINNEIYKVGDVNSSNSIETKEIIEETQIKNEIDSFNNVKETNNEIYNEPEKTDKPKKQREYNGVRFFFNVLGAVLESSANSSTNNTSTPSSSSKPKEKSGGNTNTTSTPKPTERGGTGNTNTTTKPTERGGTNTSTTPSGNRTPPANSGSGSTRRR